MTEAITAADKAMQTGSLNDVGQLLSKQFEAGLAEKYEAAIDTRANTRKSGTVVALKEQAKAELIFVIFVYGL